MRSIEVYLIIATVIVVGHSVYREVYKEGITGEICILGLGLGLTMENSIIGQIILLSGMAVYLLGGRFKHSNNPANRDSRTNSDRGGRRITNNL